MQLLELDHASLMTDEKALIAGLKMKPFINKLSNLRRLRSADVEPSLLMAARATHAPLSESDVAKDTAMINNLLLKYSSELTRHIKNEDTANLAALENHQKMVEFMMKQPKQLCCLFGIVIRKNRCELIYGQKICL